MNEWQDTSIDSANRLELSGFRNIARQQYRRRQVFGERLDEWLRLFVQVRDCEFGTGVAKVLRGRPGQAVLVRNADDEPLAAVQVEDFCLRG